MKKDEFEILKQGYKEDLRNNLKKPIEEIEQFYKKKQYVGPPSTIIDAKKTDTKDRQSQVRSVIKKQSTELGKLHFEGKSKSHFARIIQEDGKAKSSFNKSTAITSQSEEYTSNLQETSLPVHMSNFPKSKSLHSRKSKDAPER